jgi:hypothetical protein
LFIGILQISITLLVALYFSNKSVGTQQDATVSQVYYFAFMCSSTCFGRFRANNQELRTALAASGFTVGAWW